ncbi:hypothetical protein BB558_002334 [Smittium angustum]|nr:hypothetical protein BB558_002334 [Smittium angustum]
MEWIKIKDSKEQEKNILIENVIENMKKLHLKHLEKKLEVDGIEKKYTENLEHFNSEYNRIISIINQKLAHIDQDSIRNGVTSIIHKIAVQNLENINIHGKQTHRKMDIDIHDQDYKSEEIFENIEKMNISGSSVQNKIRLEKTDFEKNIEELGNFELGFSRVTTKTKLLVEEELVPNINKLITNMQGYQDSLKNKLESTAKLDPAVLSSSTGEAEDIEDYEKLGIYGPKFKHIVLEKFSNSGKTKAEFDKLVKLCSEEIALCGVDIKHVDAIDVARKYSDLIIRDVTEWSSKLEGKTESGEKLVNQTSETCDTISQLFELNSTLYTKPIVPWHTRNHTQYNEYLSHLHTL